ncbi:MAG: D-alanine--D-alanine ligase [Verrucomicrobiales bacterium]|nr:D-alanine--D-alanine ligase [Verrucomicrobiales bacterium]
MAASLTVTLMLGGPSAEREVSLASGAAVAAALRRLGHRVVELDPQPEGWTLPAETDLVFLALHGTYGEDGSVQRRLEAMRVPFTGCDADASAVAFDKALTKERLVAAGVPTPRSRVVDGACPGWPEGWRPPVVLKPVCQGSSVGLQFVEHVDDFPRALAEAARHGSPVLMEEFIRGRETTVGLLDEQVLPVVEIRPRSGRYDYASKYTKAASDYFCPADFDADTTRRIQGAGLAAFVAVGGRDYGRVDVMVGPDGRPSVLEVNTLPGMTETSLLPKAAAAAGIDFENLCQRMVDLALARRGEGAREAG